eukprot:TRINITY_DN23535_c0_g2_i1.p1 TRINITY_DN23535_c0_g2~~TRINITY_DN23535_c0_g2_i1.p1  ORF type:complete len:597 (+),score=62.66 TRINITY_DN23535_c0_g2_i1:43-1833(+)
MACLERLCVFCFCVEFVCGRACNGADEFCNLAMNDFTFAAVHSAGSHDMSIPTRLDVALTGRTLTKCYYEHHNIHVERQLNLGVRAFSIDFCGKEAEVGKPNASDWICHGSFDDEGLISFGEHLRTYLGRIKDWMFKHPNEVVLLLVEHVKRSNMERWANAVRDVFGSCVFGHDASDVVPLGCLWLDPSIIGADNLTLGSLIASGRRILATPQSVVSNQDTIIKSWSKDANRGKDFEKLFQHLSDWSKHSIGSNVGAMLGWDVFSTMRVEVPELTKKSLLTSFGLTELDLDCNEDIAHFINYFLLPPDTAENVNPSQGKSSCDGICGCLGYKSKLEALHQWVLDHGRNVFFVAADYTMYGNLIETVRRMNFATVRRRQLMWEPGIPLLQCPWFIATMVLSALLSLLLLSFLVCCCFSPQFRDKACYFFHCRDKRRRPSKGNRKNSNNIPAVDHAAAANGQEQCVNQAQAEQVAPTAAYHASVPQARPGMSSPRCYQGQQQPHVLLIAQGVGGHHVHVHQQQPYWSPAQVGTCGAHSHYGNQQLSRPAAGMGVPHFYPNQQQARLGGGNQGSDCPQCYGQFQQPFYPTATQAAVMGI